MAQRQPLLPVDYDPKCLLCAPLDQQAPGYLKGGEPVELTNLTPWRTVAIRTTEVSHQFETYFGSTAKSMTRSWFR